MGRRSGAGRGCVHLCRAQCIIISLLTAVAWPVSAATFTVNSLGDAPDVTPGNGTCETGTGNGICTLRAAINETNANGIPDTIAFSIPTGGFVGGVGTIAIASPLQITDAGTTIDGTTQAANRGDTNPGLFGVSGRVGVGADGVAGTLDEPSLPQVAAPEIEIVETGTVLIGIDIQANATTIRGIAIYGFGQTGATAQNGGDIVAGVLNVVGYSNITITGCVIGTSARGWSDPGDATRTRTSNLQFYQSDGQITNNLIGFSRVSSVRLWNAVSPGGGVPSWDISGNEMWNGAIRDRTGDCIDAPRSRDMWVHGNLMHECGGTGFDNWTDVPGLSGHHTIEDNTIRDSGYSTDDPFGSPPEPHGLRIFDSSTVIRRNIISGNNSNGVFVRSDADATISRNSIFGNGAGGGVGIDLNPTGNNDITGNSPFFTINDDNDSDTGGSDVLNFPVIDTAFLKGSDLIVTGFAPANADIELFLADPDPSQFGQGKTWLINRTEGSGADTDPNISSYSNPVNGINQGTEAGVPRFAFSIPVASLSTPVVGGEDLTATGTVSAKTSEFGGLAPVPAGPWPSVCSVDADGTFIEAENFTGTIVQGVPFAVESSLGGFTGSAYLTSTGGSGVPAPVDEGKEYLVHFNTTGLYNVWIRGYALDGSSDSIFIGLDGTSVGALNEGGLYDRWVWANGIQLGTNQINVTSTGVHRLNVWIRENNHRLDAIYITKGAETPTGAVPDAVSVLDPTSCIFTISGTLFEDIAGDALADGAIGTAGNPIEGGARVELWLDGGDGSPDGGDDTYQDFTTSSGVDGSYSFPNLTVGVYWVTVDSQGVDSGPYETGYSGFDTWCEQTYGPAGAAAFDGSSWSFAGSAGPFYGGAEWDVSDDFPPGNSLPTAEHIARVELSTSSVGNVDFGFSFNVVTNARGGSATPDPGVGPGQRTVQGSLRQFLTNANAQSASNTMRFVPAGPPNDASGDWWRIDVTDTLPVITGAGTTVDGTAYTLTAPFTQRDTNTAAIGAGATVGVGASWTTPTLDPELEILGNLVGDGLEIQAGDTTVREVAIRGFEESHADILIGAAAAGFSDVIVERCVIGTTPDSFSLPAVNSGGEGVKIDGSSNGKIRNNLIGFADSGGITIDNDAAGWEITGNEIRAGGQIAQPWADFQDGIDFESTGAGNVFRGNLIAANKGMGIDTWKASGGVTIDENTITGNGSGATEKGGARIFGSGSTLTGNVFDGNLGPGVIVVGENPVEPFPAASQNRISQNEFHDNVGLAIDLTVQSGVDLDHGAGDGVNGNDGAVDGTTGNAGMDYPIFTTASLAGSTLHVEGYVGRPGTLIPGVHTIEVYKADDDGDNDGEVIVLDGLSEPHGEGDRFIDACNSAADGRFECDLTVPGALALDTGDRISATATNPTDSTSEFGLNRTIALPIVKRAFLGDGTPIPNGTILPAGMQVKFLLYVDNASGALTDLTLQDVLDPRFAYETDSMQFDTSLLSSVVCPGGTCDEAAIFTRVNGSGTPLGDGDGDTVPVDADQGSYDSGTTTLDFGNDNNTQNAALDLPADRVLALLFTVTMQ